SRLGRSHGLSQPLGTVIDVTDGTTLFDERPTSMSPAASASKGEGRPDSDELLRGLDTSQRAAVIHESDLVAISAPAGSGKTRTLTRRIAWRCATEQSSPKRVLAVTFTRKAAGELRARLAGPLGCGEVTA